MFERLGRLATRHFVWVIVAWVGVTGLLQVVAPALKDVLTFDDAAFLSESAESIRADELLQQTWPDDAFGDVAAIVLERPEGPLRDADLGYMSALEAWLGGAEAPEVADKTASIRSDPDLERVLLSRDGRATILLVAFTTPSFEPPTNEAVAKIRAHIARTKPDGLNVLLTGESGIGADQQGAINDSVKQTTLITLVLIVLILLYIYRSPVTPLVPLATIGLALAVSQGLVALLADAGMRVSSLVETFMVVIVFGAGTDYCLFIVSRFREDVARSHEYRRTLVGTIAIVGAVIASSASTVVVGFMSQGAGRFGMFRTTGPAMAVAVAVTLVAGLTLTPALMRAFGRVLFWPAHPEDEAVRAVPETAIEASLPVEPTDGSGAPPRPRRRRSGSVPVSPPADVRER